MIHIYYLSKICCFYFFFFFSSRRRHTRLQGDWSSDVCSSDLDILSAVRQQDPETPVILMTAQASLQTAIQAVNEGAFYYIQKPFSNDDMVAICRRAADYRQLRAENKHLKQEIRRRERSGQVRPLGKSRVFLDVMRLAGQVAPTASTG